MGLPQLTFELKKAADTVVARTTQGTIGMMLKDTKKATSQRTWGPTTSPTSSGR